MERDAWRECAEKLAACLKFWLEPVCEPDQADEEALELFNKLKGETK